MKIKDVKSLIIFAAIAAPIMFACLLLLITGTVTLGFNGFGVDSYDKLYLGKNGKIEVYNNGVLENIINPRTSRGYIFTIQNNDTILLSTGSNIYTLDLDGNVISKEVDYRSRMYHDIKKMNKPYYSSKGDKYIMKHPWGWTEIAHEGEGGSKIIYQLPFLDYVVRIALLALIIGIFIFVPIIIAKFNNDSRQSIKLLFKKADRIKV